MHTKFYLDRALIKGNIIILGFALLFMSSLSLIDGLSIRPVFFLAITGVLLLIVWVGFTRGVYITVSEDELILTRFFLNSRPTPLVDIVSIHQRPTFGGLFAEVYLRVRNKDGSLRNQGLLNKPGMKESEYKRLFDVIISVNPNVKIDEDNRRR